MAVQYLLDDEPYTGLRGTDCKRIKSYHMRIELHSCCATDMAATAQALPSSGTAMLIDGQHSAASSPASVAVVYSDGSVYSVSIAGNDSQQQPPEVTSIVSAPDEAGATVAAAALDASGSRLAVVLGSAGGATSTHIHSLQVRKPVLCCSADMTCRHDLQHVEYAARQNLADD